MYNGKKEEGGYALEFLKWVFILLFFLLVLISLKDGIKGFFILWYSEGIGITLYVTFLVVFIIMRVLIRDYAYDLIGWANLFLLLYAAIPILYRLFFKREDLD